MRWERKERGDGKEFGEGNMNVMALHQCSQVCL